MLVAKQVIRQPSSSVNRNAAPGWGRSRRAMIRIPTGHPRAGAEGVGQPPGQLGDLSAVAVLTVAVHRGLPGVDGQGIDRGLDRLGRGEPDRVLQPEVADAMQERLRRAGGVGADQHLCALSLGQLGQ